MKTVSLLPADVGVDFRETKQPIDLPKEDRLRIKYLDKNGWTRDEVYSYAQARFVLRNYGYVLADKRKKKSA